MIMDGPFLSPNKSINFLAFCMNFTPLPTAFSIPYRISLVLPSAAVVDEDDEAMLKYWSANIYVDIKLDRYNRIYCVMQLKTHHLIFWNRSRLRVLPNSHVVIRENMNMIELVSKSMINSHLYRSPFRLVFY